MGHSPALSHRLGVREPALDDLINFKHVKINPFKPVELNKFFYYTNMVTMEVDAFMLKWIQFIVYEVSFLIHMLSRVTWIKIQAYLF